MSFESSLHCLPLGSTIREVITCINQNQKGIAFLVDSGQALVGSITDGDIRRAILAGQDIDSIADSLLNMKEAGLEHPISAPLSATKAEILELMQMWQVRQIPLVDPQMHVVDLVTTESMLPAILPLNAVIMAGGSGTRLRPLTRDIPKPMLPVGARPLMEQTVERLRQSGIRHVSITTHYLPEMIKGHFGDGAKFGVSISYVTEDQPLGTAGAISLLEPSDEPLLIMNGDIVTRVDFRAMLDFHRQLGADLTVGVRRYDVQVPYGVIRSEGPYVREIQEKPSVHFFVNAGIYLIEPSVRHYIPHNQRFDMTDLIVRLLAEGRQVVNFPVVEYWLDIGRPEDYEQAQRENAVEPSE